ncbi:MAG: pyridoxal phosphate-dependent aminotransferase [Thermanaerothrix sp.]|nr:pyridoxal phosphate-dependent aminotransferase [Thermanaerothrix sp.]
MESLDDWSPYDFHRPVERRGTGCKKWDLLDKIFGEHPLGMLPFWIADTEFRSYQGVVGALKERVEHAVFGYPMRDPSVPEAVAAWWSRRHRFDVAPRWVCHSHGVMGGIAVALRVFTSPGDPVVVQTPIYPPFRWVVETNHRRLVENPLREEDGVYRMDLEGLERAFKGGAKAMLLCSPHNPVGRVWTRDELWALAELAERYRVLVVSDEIHSDLVYPSSNSHTPFPSVSKWCLENSLVFGSPSKSFNLAGFYTAYAIIPNGAMRKAYESELNRLFMDQGNELGQVAMKAAYLKGEGWLEDLVRYLDGNRRFAADALGAMKGVRVTVPEGTFLMWIDFSSMLRDTDLTAGEFLKGAGVALNKGESFGEGFELYGRLNFGCSRSMLVEGLMRIRGRAEELGLL